MESVMIVIDDDEAGRVPPAVIKREADSAMIVIEDGGPGPVPPAVIKREPWQPSEAGAAMIVVEDDEQGLVGHETVKGEPLASPAQRLRVLEGRLRALHSERARAEQEQRALWASIEGLVHCLEALVDPPEPGRKRPRAGS